MRRGKKKERTEVVSYQISEIVTFIFILFEHLILKGNEVR